MFSLLLASASFFCNVLPGQALASTEVNARRWRGVVAKRGLPYAACSALPEPGRIVDDFDLFAGKQLLAGGLRQWVLVPLLEVNEDLVVGLTAIVGLGNHVNAIHCADVKLLKDAKHILAGRILEHARNADAGL